MFWSIVLPFDITFCLLAVVVAVLTVCAPALKWKRGKMFSLSLALSVLALIPSCFGIMFIVDSQRFGLFHYASSAQVNDFRIERYLPPQATDITLEKYASGHRARYLISESDLKAYVDESWEKSGQHSSVPREQLDAPRPMFPERLKQQMGIQSEFESTFERLGWKEPESEIILHSPAGGNGSGATYYYDQATGTAFHRAGYW